jgi:putative DNA primase/helicase
MSDQPDLIPIPVDDPLQLAWFECNDFGNARRLGRAVEGPAQVGRRQVSGWPSTASAGASARAAIGPASVAHEVAMHIHDEAAALGELIGSIEKPNEAALKSGSANGARPAAPRSA